MLRQALAAVLASLLGAAPALAADAAVATDGRAAAISYTWVGGSGQWTDTGKWDPPGVPGPGDTAVLGMGAEVAVTDAREVGTLVVSGGAIRTGTGTLTVLDDLATPGNSLFTGTGVTIVKPHESFASNTIQIDRGHRMRFEGDLARTGGYFYIGNSVLENPGGDEGTFEVGGTLTIPTLGNTAGVIGPTDGTGILRILPTGSFTVPAGELALSAVPENQGTMTVTGKLVAYNGVNVAGGTTTLTGSITEGDVIMSGGRLTGDGVIDDQALRVSGGTVAPDGTLTTGGLFMSGGTLEIGLDSATVFDRVVTPSAILAGALVVKAGYTPAAADSFRIVQTSLGTPQGTFGSVTDGFETAADATGVLLKAKPVVDPDPTPTPTPTPSPSATPSPTAAPSPTATPSPIAAPTPAATPSQAPSFASLVKLPRCARSRSVRVRLLAPASVRVLAGRRQLKRSSRSFTLRRRPKRAFTLRFEVTLPDGRVIKASRRFRACR